MLLFRSLVGVLVVCCILMVRAKERNPTSEEGGQSRIVGGEDAVQGRHPYMVALQRKRSMLHWCGATLIGPSIILTTKSCDYGDDLLNVHVNPYAIETEFEASKTRQTFNISESRGHPDYDDPQKFNNDFLLFKIDGTSSETPIRLNIDDDVPLVGDNNLVALGWGATNASTASPTNGLLQIASNVEYISNEECDTKLDFATMTPDWLCTMNDGSCTGDGGGPLLVPGADAFQDLQVGIVNWGVSCGKDSPRPQVYSRVSDGWEWIRSNACEMALGEMPDYFQCPSNKPSLMPTESQPPSTSLVPSLGSSDSPSITPSLGLQPGFERFLVLISTDSWPEETSWAIQSDEGEAVAGTRFGDITQENGAVPFEVRLEIGNQYVLGVFDQYGDGLCCRFGQGNVKLYYGTQIVEEALVLTVSGNFSQASFVNFTAKNPLEPTPSPTTSPMGITVCFPGDTTSCQVQGRGQVLMRDLALGDKVLVSDGTYEPIYSFGHKSVQAVSEYVQLITSSAKLELSSDHMVFVEDGKRAVPASMVKIGDQLVVGGGLSIVKDVRKVLRKGAYAPFTPSGTIVVNGVMASTFVAFQDSETLELAGFDTGITFQALAYAFEGPHRAWCRYLSDCQHEEYTEHGISTWVHVPHKVALWFFNWNPAGKSCLSILPMVGCFLILAYPVSCLLSALVIMVTTPFLVFRISKSS